MKKIIDKLTEAIAGKLQTLPPTVVRISTKKLLTGMDVGGYSPDSVQRATAEAADRSTEFKKVSRSFFRNKPQCSEINRNERPMSPHEASLSWRKSRGMSKAAPIEMVQPEEDTPPPVDLNQVSEAKHGEADF
jgi:hypothetical protein